jgi:hypothetical protein
MVLSRRRPITGNTLTRTTIDIYFASNKTISELHELMKSGAGIDPLKEFSEAARDELRAFISP